MAKNYFQYGGWNYYTLQCGMISWHWFRQVTASCNVACGSEIHQMAPPCNVICGSGITCHWICPMAASCNVTCSSGIMILNLSDGSTLQCKRWLWDEMPLNSPKHPPYCNSTSGFDFNHILHQSPKFYPNWTTVSRKKWRHVNFQDGGSQPSWILGIQWWVLWKAQLHNFL